MKKVMIIGCPGAGKSTFARKLRDLTELPLYHLDQLWHKPDRTNISREEFDAALQRILEEDAWIIDGNYQRTLEMRLQACDTVFLLDFPLEVCLAGARERVGVPHDDLPWVEEELDTEFEQWILDFPKNSLPAIYELLEKYREPGESVGKALEIVVFQSREEIERYLEELQVSI